MKAACHGANVFVIQGAFNRSSPAAVSDNLWPWTSERAFRCRSLRAGALRDQPLEALPERLKEARFAGGAGFAVYFRSLLTVDGWQGGRT